MAISLFTVDLSVIGLKLLNGACDVTAEAAIGAAWWGVIVMAPGCRKM